MAMPLGRKSPNEEDAEIGNPTTPGAWQLSLHRISTNTTSETVGIERDQRLRCFASLVAAIKRKLG